MIKFTKEELIYLQTLHGNWKSFFIDDQIKNNTKQKIKLFEICHLSL